MSGGVTSVELDNSRDRHAVSLRAILKLLSHGGRDIVVIHDRLGEPLGVSDGVTKLIGWEGAVFAAHIESLVHPEDAATLAALRVGCEATGSARQPVRIRRFDDQFQRFEATLSRYEDDGVVFELHPLNAPTDGSGLTNLDSTGSESEWGHLREIIDGSLDTLLVIDRSTKISFCSRGMTECLGFEPEVVVGQIALDFVHLDDRVVVAEALDQLLLGGSASVVMRCMLASSPP